MAAPATLKRTISPPPARKRPVSAIEQCAETAVITEHGISKPSLAAIEAGEARIKDHLAYFSQYLERLSRPLQKRQPRLSIQDFQNLYQRNQHPRGRHFVVHQHDHPIAGVHYDLRLQFSASSSISFAIPYGLPGNPKSLRPNRMAIETRVHNVWNNLIESASHATGSLMIWDTGEYEVLPRHLAQKDEVMTDDEASTGSDMEGEANTERDKSDSEKLFQAFQDRHIRLRLHGTLLPPNYTISLRLPSANAKSTQPRKPTRKRRRRAPDVAQQLRSSAPSSSSDSDNDKCTIPSRSTTASATNDTAAADAAALASDNDEDDAIRVANAYPGATNTIGSVHQRHWFLTLDRTSSGFAKARSGSERGRWIRSEQADGSVGGFETFIVRGKEGERSVVTGRSAAEIMADEGVAEFAGRKMWRAITE